MNRTPTVVGKNHEDEQEPERDGRNHKEVRRDQILRMVLKKCAPRL
jgi:hypothetical protein